MGMQVTIAGTGLTGAQLGVQQERTSARRTELKAAVLEKIESSLPGGQRHAERKAAIAAATVDIEKVSLAFNKRLKFEVDHESYDITVKVIDRETDKVIKVLPPEELQRLHNKIKETIGFLLDESV